MLAVMTACGGADDPTSGVQTAADSGVADGSWPSADAATDAPDAPVPDAAPPTPPTSLTPCAVGQCWQAPSLSNFCGSSTVAEDFTSGKYNVHEYALVLPAGVTLDLTLTVTGGGWEPALVVNTATGMTLYDGAIGSVGDPSASASSSGKGSATAQVSLFASADTPVSVFVTGWEVMDGGFSPELPPDATYSLKTEAGCTPPAPGTLLSPPNFDPTPGPGGFFLLPGSEPNGLYTRKAAACSWGSKLLVDVIYTVATHWKPLYPALSPFAVRDMNENVGACGTNHATHDDGTHADIVAGCATDIYCSDKAPKIALAKLFVDTGVVCGILNNDTAVHQTVNDYFTQKTNYAPWKTAFMRSVTGHTAHFHVRVKKPDGTCN